MKTKVVSINYLQIIFPYQSVKTDVELEDKLRQAFEKAMLPKNSLSYFLSSYKMQDPQELNKNVDVTSIVLISDRDFDSGLLINLGQFAQSNKGYTSIPLNTKLTKNKSST